ncbi:hypothetical protein AJ80_06022 [Polytolypa hystricis UAMH7299]|uniref:Nuclear localization protein n=1 Tax=Polytolypa hystricis (strain UAMH7299) TaxID=1447883 RepID=A0A2B7XYY4_POLH7|nr:hypothetical protein AJ80_06022 [Polytolypa hystricis UAMH7299]
MYSGSHALPAPMNGMGNDLIDGSGTINPAALNTAVALPSTSLTAASTAANNTITTNPNDANTSTPRGVKRGRSEDQYGDQPLEGNVEEGALIAAISQDDHQPRKRGRPPKTPRPASTATGSSPLTSSQRPLKYPSTAQTQHAPQLPPQSLPQASAAQPHTSPPAKTTPTKPVVKALPTVRDHTTDQLDKAGDEYIPKEFDESGEKKVDLMGYPLEGRAYKCRTFRVANRGNKLFMLATECARVLGYRDSYLLFNKNRSLYKIIATQTEKDDLIQQDILPYSYRSRQIAIVTARSMFRQFGSRVIVNGRRVRDDYWESKARKQGFTEDDLAGEKRPGASKARDAAAAAEAANAGLMTTLGHGDVIYSNNPHIEGLSQPPHGLPPGIGHPSGLSPQPLLPMINLAPADDPRLKEFNSIPRPRQEITGQPYQDRTQPSSSAEIMNHATQAAEFSKILNQQRSYRSKGIEDHWNKQRDVPVSSPQSQPLGALESGAVVTQSLQSPQMTAGQQQNVLAQQQQQQPMMTPQVTYSQPAHQQAPVAQSPLRGVSQAMRPDQLHHRSSNMSMSSTGSTQASPYQYSQPQQQLWGQPPPQPHPSPLSASHSAAMSQYNPQLHAQHQSPSPHISHHTPPHHPSHSPRHQNARPPPSQSQLQTPQGLAGTVPGYPGVTTSAYSSMAAARGMYPTTQATPGQQYISAQHQQQPSTVNLGMPGTSAAALGGWPAGAPLQPGQHPGAPGGWPGTY